MQQEDKKYRLLFCYQNNMNPQQGGVQKVADLLARFFISRGHQVSYLIHQKNATDHYDYPVKIYHLPDNNFFSASNIKYYQSLLEDLDIDIVINHDASNNRSVLFLNTGNYHCRKISLHHNDPLIRFNSNKKPVGIKKYLPAFILNWHKLIQTRKELQFLLDNSDQLVLLSSAFIKNIKAKTGIQSTRLTAIGNPVRPVLFDPAVKKLKHILFVGRIELQQKRPDLLLIIWSKLMQLFPDWELIVLGDGPDKKWIEQTAKEMRLQRIEFKGFVDPEPYYRDASIIAMTSDYEGFGMVLAEAMQYGVVPIAFNNWASLKDIIIDMETGVLVTSGDVNSYCSRLAGLISDAALRSRLAINVVNHVQKFDISKIGEEWLGIFIAENLSKG